jgi:hypothetical protein
VVDEHGGETAVAPVEWGGRSDGGGDWLGTARIFGLGPGGYTVKVRAPDDPVGQRLNPVQHCVVVLDADT